MAKKKSAKKTTAGTPKYPWEKWFARSRAFSIHQGARKDFQCDVRTMQQQIRNRAKRTGCTVHLKKVSETEIQITNG